MLQKHKLSLILIYGFVLAETHLANMETMFSWETLLTGANVTDWKCASYEDTVFLRFVSKWEAVLIICSDSKAKMVTNY